MVVGRSDVLVHFAGRTGAGLPRFRRKFRSPVLTPAAKKGRTSLPVVNSRAPRPSHHKLNLVALSTRRRDPPIKRSREHAPNADADARTRVRKAGTQPEPNLFSSRAPPTSRARAPLQKRPWGSRSGSARPSWTSSSGRTSGRWRCRRSTWVRRCRRTASRLEARRAGLDAQPPSQ